MNLLTFICSNVNQLAGEDLKQFEEESKSEMRQKVDSLVNQVAKVLQNSDSIPSTTLMRVVWVVGHFIAPDTTPKVQN